MNLELLTPFELDLMEKAERGINILMRPEDMIALLNRITEAPKETQ